MEVFLSFRASLFVLIINSKQFKGRDKNGRGKERIVKN